jgi:hypothetical protein
MGSCDEFARIGLFYFLEKLYTHEINYNIAICNIKNGNHVFLVLNADRKEKKIAKKNKVICDPLFNQAFFYDEHHKKLKSLVTTKIDDSDKANNCKNTNAFTFKHDGCLLQCEIQPFDQKTQEIEYVENFYVFEFIKNLYGFAPYLVPLKKIDFKGELFNGIHLLKMKKDICDKKPDLNEQDCKKLNILCDEINNTLKSSKNISCFQLLLQWKTKYNSKLFSEELMRFINELANKYPAYLYWNSATTCTKLIAYTQTLKNLCCHAARKAWENPELIINEIKKEFKLILEAPEINELTHDALPYIKMAQQELQQLHKLLKQKLEKNQRDYNKVRKREKRDSAIMHSKGSKNFFNPIEQPISPDRLIDDMMQACKFFGWPTEQISEETKQSLKQRISFMNLMEPIKSRLQDKRNMAKKIFDQLLVTPEKINRYKNSINTYELLIKECKKSQTQLEEIENRLQNSFSNKIKL